MRGNREEEMFEIVRHGAGSGDLSTNRHREHTGISNSRL